MKNMRLALAVLALCCLLVACGGGGTSAGDADIFSQPHPIATDAGLLAALAVPKPRRAATVRPLDASSFLDWAETTYPNYFPPGQTSKTLAAWTYRYYPQTDIYLGTNTYGDVLGLQGTGGGAYNSVPLGKLTDFACSVYPSDCVVVTTLAGTERPGFVNGAGTTAQFNIPNAVAADSSGNVYVADTYNHAIRKISYAGVVSTFAGGTQGFVNGAGTAASFDLPIQIAVDSSGNVFVADSGNNAIRTITPLGVVSTFAGGTQGFVNGTGTGASFNGPNGIAVDSSGNVFVADSGNHAIRKITPLGVVSTLAGNGGFGFVNGSSVAASFYSPGGVAVDSSGNVFVADRFNHAIRKITPAGVVSTFAGGDHGFANGTSTAARFIVPDGVAMDNSGNLFVADSMNNAIRKITPLGAVSTVAGNGSYGFVNDTGSAASFSNPTGVAVDSTGNVFVAQYNAIRKITPSGPPAATEPVTSPINFPLQGAIHALALSGYSSSFTISGTCTGSGNDTVTPATTVATFEGVSGFSAVDTTTMNFTNCTPATSVSNTTHYYDTNYDQRGSSGSSYDVIQTPMVIPTTVTVGGSGVLGTEYWYTDSRKTTLAGQSELSYVIEPDTESTAIVNFIAKQYNAAYISTGMQQTRYRITTTGTLTPLSFDIDIRYPDGSSVYLVGTY